MPSTSPSDPAPALSTEVKKAGKTEKTISEEKSLKKLVSPRKNMFFGRPRIRSFMVTGLSVRFHIFSASLPYSHRNTRDETADRSLRLDGRRALKQRGATGEGRSGEERCVRSEEAVPSPLTRGSSPSRPSPVAHRSSPSRPSPVAHRSSPSRPS